MAQSVLDRILNCPTLPSLPAVALRVLELTRDANVPLQKVAEVVQNDQALTGRILKTVNSSYYGLSKPCPTISRAIGLLGMNTVKSLVLGFSLVDVLQPGENEAGFDFISYWRRGVYSAAAARRLAVEARCCDPEEAFIAALLQDIGMLAMNAALGAAYNQVIAAAGVDHDGVLELERAAYEFTHAEVGVKLAARWRLPEQLADAIRCHHAPSRASAEHRSMVRLVALASMAAATLTMTDATSRLAEFTRLGEEWFRLDQAACWSLLGEIAAGAQELSRLFQVNTGEVSDVAAILSEANDQMLQHQILLEKEKESLQRSNDDLARQSMTDGLTGALNRRSFDQRIESEFSAAVAASGCLAVVFVDADRFKSVNDSHGHQVGDAVLVELARRLRGSVGERGVVCRYGGEEFAIILPGQNRAAAAHAAEAIRRAVESPPFDVRGVKSGLDELPVTVSLGVAALEPGVADVFSTAARLVLAADKAVYAAKKAGRNCVRVVNVRGREERAAAGGRPGGGDDAVVAPSEAPVPGPRPRAPGEFRVLLIEPDARWSGLMQTALADLPSANTMATRSGEAALDALRRGDGGQPFGPDLILCAAELQGPSAVALLGQIRRSTEWRTTPLLIIGPGDDSAVVRAAIEAGASAYLSRSRLADDLPRRVRQIADFWSNTARVA
jgi:diguanylate cyclase (GGDEF)-like protein